MSTATPGGTLIRLTPWRLDEIPSHPSIPPPTSSPTPPPDLPTFILAFLDSATSFLSPSTFSKTFTPHSTKSAPPSSSPVEVHKLSIPTSTLQHAHSSPPSSSTSPTPRRHKPPTNHDPETWFARRSYHQNISSKQASGTASWAEFVYGLRDEHSRHEQDFTPTLYDAHHILDWNDEIRRLETENKFVNGGGYSKITMSIYEMCHAIPPPLNPRCFPVLVITAATSSTSFVAVTVPVDLSSLSASYYTSKRNVKEGKDAQQRKEPVLGVYAAVETVRIVGDGDGDGKRKGEIEWTMATASDAKGNLPAFAQKMSIPGAIVKDVGFFMKWIPTVKEEEVRRQEVGTH